MKRILIAACLLGLLSACAIGQRAGRGEIAVYDLGAAGSPPATPAHAGVGLEVRLPAWLDTQAMTYRLDYAEAQRIRAYAQSRWAAPPVLLLQQRLRQQLALAPGGGACTLRVELDDFGQHFDSPSSSRAVLRGEALLIARARTPLARHPVRVEVAAAADAAGGAIALAAASDRLAASLGDWLRSQDLAACRPAG